MEDCEKVGVEETDDLELGSSPHTKFLPLPRLLVKITFVICYFEGAPVGRNEETWNWSLSGSLVCTSASLRLRGWE